VGEHYTRYLLSKDPSVEIVGADIKPLRTGPGGDTQAGKVTFYRGSFLDKKWVFDIIKRHKPDRVINLASYSSVAFSWENPSECFVNNTNIFLNIIDSVRELKSGAKVLSVGSSEEYGPVSEKDMPLEESMRTGPINPYAAARVAQENLSGVYAAGYGLDIVCTRSFNHVGPGQPDIFAVSSFARQVTEARLGLRDKITCGNLGIVRDFIDVRDVVKAYDLLLEKGKKGEIYNVCSGEGYRLSEVLEMLKRKAGVDAPVEKNAALVRPADNPVIVGSCRKLESATGFKRKYDLSRSLDDILAYWKNSLERASGISGKNK